MYRRPSSTILSQMLVMLMAPLLMWSQSQQDTMEINYDSIQDVRINQMERRVDRRLDRIEEEQLKNVESLDSMKLVLEDLLHHVEHLEQEKLLQSERLSLMQDEIEHSQETSKEYRKDLRRNLWIVGSFMLILLVTSFLVLLLYSLKNRNLVERLRWKLKQIRSEIKTLTKKQQYALQSQKKEIKKASRIKKRSLRKIAGKALQQQLKTIKIKKK